ncbi:MAG: recombinase RecT [Rhodospirillaceae bacterium]|nr:recombinase RecT [Rhodospirillaceae bacterium]
MSNNPLTIFRNELVKMEPQFDRVLPAHLTVARLTRTIESCVSRNPRLLQADRKSLWEAAMTAAVFGLECDGWTGQGHLVPFKGKVQFIPGYQGLITLAFNSGYIVQGHVVRQSDIFSYQYGLEPALNHAPDRTHDRGADNPIVAAYATARGKDLIPVFEVMELPELLDARAKSSGWQAFKSGKMKDNPWESDFEAMARKTPIRRLASHLPLNFQKAVAIEAMAEQGVNAHAEKMPDGTINIEGEAVDVSEGDG